MTSSARSRRVTAVLLTICSALTPFCVTAAEPVDEGIDEIVVTADMRGRLVSEVPASISVFDAEQIERLASQHFEELINSVPNLNWSGDGHRARYFQIRGIGELEQYQGAPNPSVGLLIDDIDFSGIGTIATLFDVDRIEVLRGSQGSRYGANALAGLIYMQSTLPSAERNGRVQLSAGNDDAWSLGLAVGGSVAGDERALFRVSAHRHESNGYRDNSYLGRDDTNAREESIVRGRLLLQPAANLDISIATLFSKVDNGYDAFALDNSYTTLSDKPGRDAQESIGASVKLEWSGISGMSLTSITALADSDIEFGFDADWGNDDSWAPFSYDYISLSDRKRRTLSQELRLTSAGDSVTSWLIGLYALRLEDELATVNQGDYFDPFFNFADSLDDSFVSDYYASNIAVFGQWERRLSERVLVSTGLRLERRSTDYSDSAGLTLGPSESMAGGEITLRFEHSESLTSFAGISKAYKAGGFNLGPVPAGRREYEQEELWSIEAGIKARWMAGKLNFNAALFYSQRNDQQVRTSIQLIPGDPASFVFFTDNAAAGESVGLEADMRWIASDSWEFFASAGLLDASFDQFQTPLLDLSGRAQAHAPTYTISIGTSYRHPSGWFAQVDANAKDEFYFDVSHDQTSKAYELLNARFGFEAAVWSAQLRIRNLFDQRYAVRGFFFGNEPPDFPNTLYTRLGDARHISFSYDRRF